MQITEPIFDKSYTEGKKAWGPFLFVTTDDLTVLPKLAEIFGTSLTLDLEEFIPIQTNEDGSFKTRTSSELVDRLKTLPPTTPFIGYLKVTEEENALISEQQKEERPWRATKACITLRRYPETIYFLSTIAMDYAHGVATVWRWQVGSTPALTRHLLERL